MGSFLGHIVPGTFLFAFGLWWTFAVVDRYFRYLTRLRSALCSYNSNKRSRPHHPAAVPASRWARPRWKPFGGHTATNSGDNPAYEPLPANPPPSKSSSPSSHHQRSRHSNGPQNLSTVIDLDNNHHQEMIHQPHPQPQQSKVNTTHANGDLIRVSSSPNRNQDNHHDQHENNNMLKSATKTGNGTTESRSRFRSNASRSRFAHHHPRHHHISHATLEYRNTPTYNYVCVGNSRGNVPVEGYVKVIATTLGILGEYFTALDSAGHFVHYGNAQHITMFLMFGLNGLVDIVVHWGWPLPRGISYLTLAGAIFVEGILFTFHLHGRTHLDVHIHTLLIISIGLCLVFVLAEWALPASPLMGFLRPYGALVQGTWFYQIGFVLYPPSSSFPQWDGNDHMGVMMITAMFCWHLTANALLVFAVGLVYYFRYRARLIYAMPLPGGSEGGPEVSKMAKYSLCSDDDDDDSGGFHGSHPSTARLLPSSDEDYDQDLRQVAMNHGYGDEDTDYDLETTSAAVAADRRKQMFSGSNNEANTSL